MSLLGLDTSAWLATLLFSLNLTFRLNIQMRFLIMERSAHSFLLIFLYLVETRIHSLKKRFGVFRVLLYKWSYLREPGNSEYMGKMIQAAQLTHVTYIVLHTRGRWKYSLADIKKIFCRSDLWSKISHVLVVQLETFSP